MIEETGIEYAIFIETFMCLKIAGFWLPTTLKQPRLQLCYRLYTVFTSISISFMIFGTLLYIALSQVVWSSFVENWCIAAIVCNTLCGCLNIMMKRKTIIDLIRTKVTADRWTKSRDDKEVEIIASSYKAEQSMLRWWMGLVAVNGVMNVINPIISENPDNNMIYNSWLPCDRHESSCFWICWSNQVLSFIYGCISHVSSDCIVFNLIVRVCSNVRILQHRLALLPFLVSTGVVDTAEKERRYLIECILDHQNIYSIIFFYLMFITCIFRMVICCLINRSYVFSSAKEISQIFRTVISLHFTLTCSILCTSIYLLSTQPLFSNSFIAIGLFLCCMLAQTLIHCCYGYRLSQIGDDISYTIFSMDWLELRRETRKALGFIMLSVSKSIPLFNSFIVELSPEMFLKILKISYSAFNLLQTQS